MSQLTLVSRILLSGGIAMAATAACGGSAFSGGDDGSGNGGQGGSNGIAGSRNSAGSKSAGGSSSSGGRATAGNGTGGGSAGTASAGTSAGGGAGWPEQCMLPSESGPCEAYIQSWYHDARSGICKPFGYGGCGGNANNYASLEECQKVCSGGTPNLDACQAATDCAIGSPSCCGACDGAGVSAHNFIAYARKHQNAVYEMCQLVDIACAPCYQPPADEEQLKYFIPDCVQGQCVVHDIRKSAVTACKTEQDCRLRSGTQCCEGCGSELVSVANNGGLEKLVCGDMPFPCPALLCAPTPGTGVSYCDAGHCAVDYAIDIAP